MRRKIDLWMWAEACETVRRADRLQHRFFEPGEVRDAGPAWEPPVDLFETETGVHVVVALPGVAAEHLQLTLHEGMLAVRGERRLNIPAGRSRLHRLEIPNGRFERRIALPARHYQVREHKLSAGCLTVVLDRV